MRTVSWLLIVGLFLTVAYPVSAAVKRGPRSPITEISMAHYPGMPIPGQPARYFRVTFSRDGSAVYKGLYGDRPEGIYTGKINTADFERLTGRLEEMTYRGLRSYYPMGTDASFNSLFISEPNRRKEITHGDSGSYDKTEDDQIKSLVAFERLIDDAIKRIHWTKVNPAKKKK